MTIFINGAFAADDKAKLSLSDRGFAFGDGVFDTMLVENGAPVEAKAHFERLLRHAAVLRIATEETVESLESIAAAMINRNHAATGRHALRTTITRGPASRGLAPPAKTNPTLAMQIAALPDPAGIPPVNAVIAQSTRRNEFSPLSYIKSLSSYGDNLLALLEAQERGANEAILLNTRGHAACATTSFLFVLFDGRLTTPLAADGVMESLTRARLMQQFGIREEHISPARLMAADGVYIANSVTGIRPVETIEGRALPSRNDFLENILMKAAA